MPQAPVRIALPIDPHLAAITAAVETHPAVVLKASPGSGKTTRVPAALLESRLSAPEIWVLEPRRLAAKWAAHRVAEERGEAPGETVGYQFRFEKREGPRTRLRFLTEGVLLRKLKSDPELRRVGVVVLDEFHERHLTTDLALTCLLDLQRRRRPDLKLVIMSATLDIQGLQQVLGSSAPAIEIEAPRFPVDIRHSPEPLSRRLDDEVARAVKALSAETSGDMLVFLPGMGEILRAKQAIESLPLAGTLDVIPLHGELSREEQDRAMLPSPKRKVILSTNLAESSITIPGITVVIDSGLHRQASHSHWSGIPALRTRPISKASSVQRAGRAGRTAPGICHRLYTRGDFDGRAPFDTPEILRADLAQVLLDLKALGVGDPFALPWLELPPRVQWDAAAKLLWLLGVLSSTDPAAPLTSLGEKLSSLSMHPRLARLLFEARQNGTDAFSAALAFAACLSEGELPSRHPLEDAGILAGRVPQGFSLRRAAEQWSREFENVEVGKSPTTAAPTGPLRDRLLQSILRAFPDRVVRTLPDGILAESALSGSLELQAELRDEARGKRLFAIALEAQERQLLRQSERQLVRQSERQLLRTAERRNLPVVESWAPFPEDWLLDLEPSLVEESETAAWDSSRERVKWISELRYGAIALSRDERDPRSEDEWRQAETLLLKQAWKMEVPDAEISTTLSQEFVHQLRNQGQGELADLCDSLFARLILIRESGLFGEALPRFTELFASALTGKLAIRQLAEMDWETELSRSLSELRPGVRLDEWTPSHVQLTGRRAKIQYRLGHEPWVESRLQDFIGLKQGPKILAGRVPLTLHLLAPNHRAVQVTKDLAGFWERAYPEIRQQLMRRYPRHQWP
jgi:ATP-dependent helicase HrpB